MKPTPIRGGDLAVITLQTIELENFRNFRKRRCRIINVRRKSFIDGSAA